MIRPPSITALLCLEASARLHSFTHAAAELHLTQGAVSRQIITLEERLGVQLFVRKREALALTEAGSYYLQEVGPLLQRLDRATANVMALRGRGGSLALSLGASLGTYWLIPRLPAFTRAHGEITLNFVTRIGSVDFGNTPVDASLEFGSGQRAGMHNEFVLPLVVTAYASPAWAALHGKEISGATRRSHFIHHNTVPEGWKEWFKLLNIEGDPGSEGPRYDLMSMALHAAIAGLGVALLPSFMTVDALASHRLVRLSTRQWRSAKGYYLVYPDTSAQLQSLQIFKAWLLEQAQAAL